MSVPWGRLLLAVLAVVLVVGVIVLLDKRLAGSATTQVQPLAAEERLPLESPHGQVTLGDFRGKLVLLNFGYTFCPDICPTTLATWAQALTQLKPDELARVQPIFVTVDPERDTVERLGPYAAFFHPALLGLTGSPQTLRAVAGYYGVIYQHQGATTTDYAIDHTATTFLIDAQGRRAEKLRHDASAAKVLAAVRRRLPPSP